MTEQAGARSFRRLSFALFLPALALGGCTDPETFIPFPEVGGPAGVMDGVVTYSGPPPCTEKGHIVGAAVLLGLDVRLLPPPEGLGSGAPTLAAVPGDTLFAGIRETLKFDEKGALVCPDAGATPVTVSADWVLGPLPAGDYEVRGFYDRDGNFNPAFSISNLPSRGDIGGGAIENAAEVLQGKPPRYRVLGLGKLGTDGKRSIDPETGARISGVTVTLGQPLPLERPVFFPSAVDDTIEGNKDPKNVTIPADFQFPVFGPSDSAFVRITYNAGVATEEVDVASVTPFFMPVKGASFHFLVEDVNHDGVYDSKDHVPDSVLLPSLYPLSIFSRLNEGSKLSSQMQPRVVMQGLTLYQNLLITASKKPADPDPMNPMPTVPFQGDADTLTVAIRPAALCIDPLDPKKNGVLVVSHDTDAMGTKILADEAGTKAGLKQQFGRDIDIVYGCLPQGHYAMNLIYPTGQAWTLPNEAGVCQAGEPQTADGKFCQSVTNAKRARLASQDAMLTVGPPKDAAYCKTNPTPAQCFPAK